MHITAMNPEYKTRADVPADAAEKVKAMFAEEVAASDKPAEIKEKIPNSDKPPTPKTLDDVGRRYEHLMDLRDVWEGGLYTLSRIRPAYISKADEILKASLTTALNLLNKQIDSMSGIDHKLFEIRKRIDG